jgi:hypothetical protein
MDGINNMPRTLAKAAANAIAAITMGLISKIVRYVNLFIALPLRNPRQSGQ